MAQPSSAETTLPVESEAAADMLNLSRLCGIF